MTQIAGYTSGTELTALLLLERADVVHPLVQVLRYRFVSDATYATPDIPHVDDVTPDEWRDACDGDGEDVARWRAEYDLDRHRDGHRTWLHYPIDDGLDSDARWRTECIIDHHQERDRAALRLMIAIAEYRLERDEEALAREIEMYHDWILRMTDRLWSELQLAK